HACFSFSAAATPPPSPLSLHDALPIYANGFLLSDMRNLYDDVYGPFAVEFEFTGLVDVQLIVPARTFSKHRGARHRARDRKPDRSEEHTSELQSRENLVCRLLLEKKKK